MLSSRYLHLHEALGLGPMWLNRQAEVKPLAGKAAAEQPSRSMPESVVKPVVQAVGTVAAASGNAARLAVVQAAGVHKKQTQAAVAAWEAVPAATTQTAVALSDGLQIQWHTDIRPSELMVVSICPSTEDGMAGQLFSGQVGVLLDNMLAAIGLAPEQVHKTCWVKAAPVFSPTPEAEQIQAELPALQAELAAAQARAVLFLGQIFQEPDHADWLQQLCGQTPYFIIPHPARLLRQPHLKAQAWTVLKQVRQILLI